jgi:hypothetical protein
MTGTRPNRITIATLALTAPLALLAGARSLDSKPAEPSAEELRSLVEGYAHAIETNNRELALSYVHATSPQRSEIDAALRDQLASYMERARTSALQLRHPPPSDGTVSATTVSARVDQEIVRVFGMKLTRGMRRSTYHFRQLGDSWRIWGIEVLTEGPGNFAGPERFPRTR